MCRDGLGGEVKVSRIGVDLRWECGVEGLDERSGYAPDGIAQSYLALFPEHSLSGYVGCATGFGVLVCVWIAEFRAFLFGRVH